MQHWVSNNIEYNKQLFGINGVLYPPQYKQIIIKSANNVPYFGTFKENTLQFTSACGKILPWDSVNCWCVWEYDLFQQLEDGISFQLSEKIGLIPGRYIIAICSDGRGFIIEKSDNIDESTLIRYRYVEDIPLIPLNKKTYIKVEYRNTYFFYIIDGDFETMNFKTINLETPVSNNEKLLVAAIRSKTPVSHSDFHLQLMTGFSIKIKLKG